MEKLKVLGKRIFIVAGLALLVFLLMDFNNRMASLTRLSAQNDIEEEKLYELQVTKAYLETQVAYAGSDKAVEAWAREEGRYVLEGDVPIFLLTPVGYTPEPKPQPTPTVPSYTFLEAWEEWFFSDAP
jgi:cell division protein FtsB